jgi:tagatose-1,6-bisphosphate aldolase
MAGPDGIVVGVAVDHRDSLRAVLERKGISAPPDELLSAMKLRIVRALAPGATLVLADAEYAAAQAIAGHALPGGTALATPLEAQGYGDAAEGAATTLLEDWSPRAAAHLGATACKLLLPYRADEPAHAEAQEEVVRTALEACEEAGVALILEPIVYGSPQEDELAALVVEGASRLASLGPDVLKLQYPGSLAACRLLDEACGPEIPWVLLGGGADAKTLAGRIEDACRAGASGFVVGRTLWDAALVADADESERALEGLSVPMLERLAATARRHGRPWRDRVGPVESPQLGWYR